MPLYELAGVRPTLAKDAWVAPNATVIGDVHLGEASSIWFSCVLRGDYFPIRIGARTNIQDGSVVHITAGKAATTIGDDVTVGHMALLHACTIGDGAFVGMMACVMDGAEVEKGAMVAAGALVTPGKRVPTGQVWAGSPAKFMRDMTPEEVKYLPWSANHYVNLAKNYLP